MNEPCSINDKKLMFKAGGLVITNQTQRAMETIKKIKAVNKNLWTESGELYCRNRTKYKTKKST